MIQLLIVEDDENKLDSIRDLFDEDKFNIDTASSFKEAQNKLLNNIYELVIMDISLPTFDKNHKEKGGKWRSFGGEELLEEMIRYERSSKVFIVSAYDKLGMGDDTVSFWQLKDRLKKNFASLFVGGAYFDTFQNEWKELIKKMLKKEFKL